MLNTIYVPVKLKLLLLVILLSSSSSNCFFDPITIGIGAGISAGIYNWGTLKDQTYCRFYECCDQRSIPNYVYNLEATLKSRLFGQHIVFEQLVPALKAHFSSNTESRKPLVISFHGTPGTGKNFVAQHIAEALYTKGLQSKYVHKFFGRADFPLESAANDYKEIINTKVRKGLVECERSLFIFDEVDKMPPGVFESLTSLVDYNTIIDGKVYNKAIFLFLSNTAGVHISNHLAGLIKNGKIREETRLSDFEQILQTGAYNLDGGLKKTSLIEAHVIDHFLPFLPLEKSHVYECVKAEFLRWGIRPNSETIEEILQDYVTYDPKHQLFATSGCKTLEKKVAVYAISAKQISV